MVRGGMLVCILQANTTDSDGLESLAEAGAAFNIGIILMRKSTLEFTKVRAPNH